MHKLGNWSNGMQLMEWPNLCKVVCANKELRRVCHCSRVQRLFAVRHVSTCQRVRDRPGINVVSVRLL
jgi:hypothetical protein